MEAMTDFISLGSNITADGDFSHEIKRFLLLGGKAVTNLDSIVKNQRHYFADKSPYSQSYNFSNSNGQMWELDHKEDWVPNNWCFGIVVLEKTLESPLGCKDFKPVNPKGNQILSTQWKDWCWSWSWSSNTWPPNAKSQLTGKDPDAFWRLKAGEGSNRG